MGAARRPAVPVVTPVAHAIVREMCKPLKARRLHDPDNVGARLADAHCFDVSAVRDMAIGLAVRPADLRDSPTCFLPSPVTVLADGVRLPSGGRCETLAVSDVGGVLRLRLLSEQKDGAFQIGSAFAVVHPGGENFDVRAVDLPRDTDDLKVGVVLDLFLAMLAIINSPHVVARTLRPPHTGLQREVGRARGMGGRYPTLGTTEVKLIVGARDACTTQTTRLSGERALHFVRQHMRVVGGTLTLIGGVPVRLGGDQTLVKAHWRGSPARGIKRSRYRVEPAT